MLRCQACDERSDGAATLHPSHAGPVLGMQALGSLRGPTLQWACKRLAGGLAARLWEMLSSCSICVFVPSCCDSGLWCLVRRRHMLSPAVSATLRP